MDVAVLPVFKERQPIILPSGFVSRRKGTRKYELDCIGARARATFFASLHLPCSLAGTFLARKGVQKYYVYLDFPSATPALGAPWQEKVVHNA
ncbi:MAG: hypothetical protein D6747_04850 [Chlorobiota bacterium]|jgi:hypothetical protein|nr:MAG: hypothetical protein D6747_04850 [Chlorobiota bacterium]